MCCNKSRQAGRNSVPVIDKFTRSGTIGAQERGPAYDAAAEAPVDQVDRPVGLRPAELALADHQLALGVLERQQSLDAYADQPDAPPALA